MYNVRVDKNSRKQKVTISLDTDPPALIKPHTKGTKVIFTNMPPAKRTHCSTRKDYRMVKNFGELESATVKYWRKKLWRIDA